MPWCQITKTATGTIFKKMSNSLGMAADIPKYFKNVWDWTSLQLLPTEHVDVWASVSMNEEKR